MHVKRQRTLSSAFFSASSLFLLRATHTCIQLGEERFLEALNILSLPNASLLLKSHQASSDPIGSLLWGFPDMLHISVAQTPNSCHKQSVNTEKPLWNTISLPRRLLQTALTVPSYLESFCILLARICHLRVSWRGVCLFFLLKFSSPVATKNTNAAKRILEAR